MPDEPAALRPGSTEAGFYRYERMLPVVVLGLVLAIAVPYGLRRHVEGQVKAAVADLRVLQVAMVGYKAANGGFYDSRLACLVNPGCLPDRGRLPAGILDASLASAESRHGYRFRLVPGPPPKSVPPTSSPTSVVSYCYMASPDAH